jgi:transcriptional regulator with XRE-family HTH domain
MPHSFGPIDEPTAEALRVLGRILYELRRQRGLSQRALAARCGLSQATISRLENGLAPGVRIAWIARLLAGLDLDVPWPGHEPWNAWTAPGWVLLMEQFSLRGRLAGRLEAGVERVPERPKGGHPYRRRPPITNPSDAYLEAVERSAQIAAFEAPRLAADQRHAARMAKVERDALVARNAAARCSNPDTEPRRPAANDPS